MPRQPLVRALHWMFATWRFPVFVLSMLVFYELVLVALLFLPDTGGALGAFALDFKIWCFGYDPATRHLQPMSVVMMLTEPLTLAATMLFVWWRPLRALMTENPRRILPWAGAALAMVVVATVVLGAISDPTASDTELPFPAERLRTEHTPPEFTLVSHTGEPLSLESLRGRVVMMTAVYATCGYTCPMIMGQAKRAIAHLSEEEQKNLVVVGVTLDPEHDTPEVLAAMAKGQEISAPLFHLVTGDPARVNALLDELQVARTRDPRTGVIDHANLFVLIDRGGRIAYRFSLGERQERWLESALKLLVREPETTG